MVRVKGLALLWLLSILVLGGCATALPDVSALMEEKAAKSATISGPGGKLKSANSEQILSRLEQKAGPTDLVQINAALMESLSGNPLTTGNKATLLVDGAATYAAIFKAVAEAKDHINVETYQFEDDEIGRRFSDLLLRKRAEGIQVNLIFDSVGSSNTPAAFFEKLREGGVKVVEFNPLSPLKAKSSELVTHRDHRKVVVVDGMTAFTGGVNFSSVYSSSPSRSGGSQERRRPGWRDTHVMIEGPAVAQFQTSFMQTWQSQNGPPLDAADYFPRFEPRGTELITVVGSTPGDPNRLTYVMYVSAIKQASRSIHITNSYFVPDRQTLDSLEEAAGRGVDVALIVPGVSDSNLALYAGRSYYEDLLEAGVKVYEHNDRVLHAKTAVIDGVWSTIGSTNFDLWSFMRNDELNAIILGVDFANQMESLFKRDIGASSEVTRQEWSGRPIWTRMREWIARLMAHWL
ncbi:MAG TPA: cardiolipin synthase [Syntrophorhabdaceae bacterium]|jgi:cardiolipin synthase